MSTFDADAINTLGEKIEGLQISDDEQRVLDALLIRATAADDDVQGFDFALNFEEIKVTYRNPTAQRLGGALGFVALSGTFE